MLVDLSAAGTKATKNKAAKDSIYLQEQRQKYASIGKIPHTKMLTDSGNSWKHVGFSLLSERETQRKKTARTKQTACKSRQSSLPIKTMPSKQVSPNPKGKTISRNPGTTGHKTLKEAIAYGKALMTARKQMTRALNQATVSRGRTVQGYGAMPKNAGTEQAPVL